MTSCAHFFQSRSRPFQTVVVDAGHGGHDRGARAYQQWYEKDLALDTAQRLAKILKERGLRVVFTRSNDTFIPLGIRTAIANATPSSVFVSIHYNWSPASASHGIETYYYTSQSQYLADRVQQQLIASVHRTNRGVKRRGFYVLRNTQSPAILVECGFVSNPQENAACQSAAERQHLAEAIANALVGNKK